MVARATSPFNSDDYVEVIHTISDKYKIYEGLTIIHNHSAIPRYDLAVQTITFYVVVRPPNLFQKIKHWLYPDLGFEILDLSCRKIYTNGKLNSIDWTSYGRYVTREQAFDWFRENHPEIFEWILFHLELF